MTRFFILSVGMCMLLNCKMHTTGLMYANINCGNFKESCSFYEMVGFIPLIAAGPDK